MIFKKINIAIVGFGNIGSYFYKTLEKNKKSIALKTGKMPSTNYISAKNINKKREIKIPKSKWIKNPLDLTSKNLKTCLPDFFATVSVSLLIINPFI